jgi:hypothetical protein
MVSTDPVLWIQAFFVIAIFSFAFRDNIAFRFSEHTYIGVMMAYQFVIAVKYILDQGTAKLSAGNTAIIIPMILGLLLYTRYTKEYFYLSRWSLSLIIGVMTGLYLSTIIQAQIIAQVKSTIVPLTGVDFMTTINNLLIICMVILSLYYFIFTSTIREQTPLLPRLGRYIIMVALGVAFGGTVATRYGLFTGQLQFLMYDWLGLIP